MTDTSGRQVLHFYSASQGLFIATDGSHIPRVIEFEFSNQLCPGEYGLIAGIGLLSNSPRNKGQSLVENLYDYCVGGARFSVRFPDEELAGSVGALFMFPILFLRSY